MTATMKGLLKGLRYISQIFENSDEDEPEMQIGNPTDVKHVAHIGWDGPSVNSPSWMNDYKSSNESSSAPLSAPQRKKSDNPVPQPLEISNPRHYSSLDVPSPEPEERKTRRRHSAGGSINSPGRDAANGLKPKKHQHHHSSVGVDSSDPNYVASPPNIPKKSRKKKSKESTTDGSTSKSRLKSNKAKSKDNECPVSGVKDLSLDDTNGSGDEFQRQDREL